MRIIDKYLLKEFTWPLVYCFDAFAMLWIVQELLDNLYDFIQFHAPLKDVLRYYLIVLPEAIVIILPMSLLLGVLFCLTNLGKHNELIALRASGLSVTRFAVPLLAIGLVATIAAFGINEAFVPRAKERADAFMSILRGRGEKFVVENFFYVNSAEHRDWYARRFNTRSGEMENVEVHQQKPDGAPDVEFFAERGRWADGKWTFYGADIYDYNRKPLNVLRVTSTNFPAFKEVPKRMVVESKKPAQLMTSELRRYIRAMQRAGRKARLAEYQVEYQRRYALPLLCFMAVWIGVPLGTRVSRRGPLLGVGMALLLFVTYYLMSEITRKLGEAGQLTPVLAAWLTNLVFGIVGGVLLVRAR